MSEHSRESKGPSKSFQGRLSFTKRIPRGKRGGTRGFKKYGSYREDEPQWGLDLPRSEYKGEGYGSPARGRGKRGARGGYVRRQRGFRRGGINKSQLRTTQGEIDFGVDLGDEEADNMYDFTLSDEEAIFKGVEMSDDDDNVEKDVYTKERTPVKDRENVEHLDSPPKFDARSVDELLRRSSKWSYVGDDASPKKPESSEELVTSKDEAYLLMKKLKAEVEAIDSGDEEPFVERKPWEKEEQHEWQRTVYIKDNNERNTTPKRKTSKERGNKYHSLSPPHFDPKSQTLAFMQFEAGRKSPLLPFVNEDDVGETPRRPSSSLRDSEERARYESPTAESSRKHERDSSSRRASHFRSRWDSPEPQQGSHEESIIRSRSRPTSPSVNKDPHIGSEEEGEIKEAVWKPEQGDEGSGSFRHERSFDSRRRLRSGSPRRRSGSGSRERIHTSSRNRSPTSRRRMSSPKYGRSYHSSHSRSDSRGHKSHSRSPRRRHRRSHRQSPSRSPSPPISVPRYEFEPPDYGSQQPSNYGQPGNVFGADAASIPPAYHHESPHSSASAQQSMPQPPVAAVAPETYQGYGAAYGGYYPAQTYYQSVPPPSYQPAQPPPYHPPPAPWSEAVPPPVPVPAPVPPPVGGVRGLTAQPLPPGSSGTPPPFMGAKPPTVIKKDPVEEERDQQRLTLVEQRNDYASKVKDLKKELDKLNEVTDKLKETSDPNKDKLQRRNQELQGQLKQKIRGLQNVMDLLNKILGEKTNEPAKQKKRRRAHSSSSASSGEARKRSKEKKKISKEEKVIIPKEDIKAKKVIEPKPEEIKHIKKKSKEAKMIIAEMKSEAKKKAQMEQLAKEEMQITQPLTKEFNIPATAVKEEEDEEDNGEVNYVYFDSESHWCRVCNVFPRTAKDFLTHLQTPEHREEIQCRRLVEYPWHRFGTENPPPKKLGPTKRVPIKGLPFFISVPAWYCKLCDSWIGDLHCASLHLKSEKHNKSYKEFIGRNAHWETMWMAERERGIEKSAQERLKAREAVTAEKSIAYSVHVENVGEEIVEEKDDDEEEEDEEEDDDNSEEESEEEDKSRSIRILMRNKGAKKAPIKDVKKTSYDLPSSSKLPSTSACKERTEDPVVSSRKYDNQVEPSKQSTYSKDKDGSVTNEATKKSKGGKVLTGKLPFIGRMPILKKKLKNVPQSKEKPNSGVSEVAYQDQAGEEDMDLEDEPKESVEISVVAEHAAKLRQTSVSASPAVEVKTAGPLPQDLQTALNIIFPDNSSQAGTSGQIPQSQVNVAQQDPGTANVQYETNTYNSAFAQEYSGAWNSGTTASQIPGYDQSVAPPGYGHNMAAPGFDQNMAPPGFDQSSYGPNTQQSYGTQYMHGSDMNTGHYGHYGAPGPYGPHVGPGRPPMGPGGPPMGPGGPHMGPGGPHMGPGGPHMGPGGPHMGPGGPPMGPGGPHMGPGGPHMGPRGPHPHMGPGPYGPDNYPHPYGPNMRPQGPFPFGPQGPYGPDMGPRPRHFRPPGPPGYLPLTVKYNWQTLNKGKEKNKESGKTATPSSEKSVSPSPNKTPGKVSSGEKEGNKKEEKQVVAESEEKGGDEEKLKAAIEDQAKETDKDIVKDSMDVKENKQKENNKGKEGVDVKQGQPKENDTEKEKEVMNVEEGQAKYNSKEKEKEALGTKEELEKSSDKKIKDVEEMKVEEKTKHEAVKTCAQKTECESSDNAQKLTAKTVSEPVLEKVEKTETSITPEKTDIAQVDLNKKEGVIVVSGNKNETLAESKETVSAGIEKHESANTTLCLSEHKEETPSLYVSVPGKDSVLDSLETKSNTPHTVKEEMTLADSLNLKNVIRVKPACVVEDSVASCSPVTNEISSAHVPSVESQSEIIRVPECVVVDEMKTKAAKINPYIQDTVRAESPTVFESKMEVVVSKVQKDGEEPAQSSLPESKTEITVPLISEISSVSKVSTDVPTEQELEYLKTKEIAGVAPKTGRVTRSGKASSRPKKAAKAKRPAFDDDFAMLGISEDDNAVISLPKLKRD